jgi:hypothetical protein
MHSFEKSMRGRRRIHSHRVPLCGGTKDSLCISHSKDPLLLELFESLKLVKLVNDRKNE